MHGNQTYCRRMCPHENISFKKGDNIVIINTVSKILDKEEYSHGRKKSKIYRTNCCCVHDLIDPRHLFFFFLFHLQKHAEERGHFPTYLFLACCVRTRSLNASTSELMLPMAQKRKFTTHIHIPLHRSIQTLLILECTSPVGVV